MSSKYRNNSMLEDKQYCLLYIFECDILSSIEFKPFNYFIIV